MRLRELTNEATGLSPATLSSYKKKAGTEASALDKEAFEKGGPDAQAKLDKAHKRYKGINKATQKQFDNDVKGIKEEVGQEALEFKRSDKYPDGKSIPESLPARYQPSSNPGVPDNQKCSNCLYYDTKTKKCDKFEGDPVVRPEYWCAKWKSAKVEENEKNPHTSALGKALDRALSKEKKASPAQQQRNKERWAQRQKEREQGVAEGLSDIVKGVKRKVAGKEDPKEVEHTYGRIARSAIKHKTPDQSAKDIERYKKVAKVVNKESVAEGSEERSQKRLWAQITDYEQRAKATKNDIKRDHYLKMASELRGKLKTTDDVEESQVNEISTKLRDKYVTRATDDYGHANFAARASKSHPGLEKYSQEQETRAKKRAAGLNRALSDKRLGRVEESGNDTISFEVDSERAYNHIMDKFGHVIEWDGDAMVIPSKYWGAVQELAYAAGGEATEYNIVDEASLATMRDYFAGDENAKDEMKITQMRKYYANAAEKEKTKNFNSLASYHHWLKQVGAEKINRK